MKNFNPQPPTGTPNKPRPVNAITCRACANWDPDSKDGAERSCWINNQMRKAEDATCQFFTI